MQSDGGNAVTVVPCHPLAAAGKGPSGSPLLAHHVFFRPQMRLPRLRQSVHLHLCLQELQLQLLFLLPPPSPKPILENDMLSCTSEVFRMLENRAAELDTSDEGTRFPTTSLRP